MRSGETSSGLRYAVRQGGKGVAWCALSIRCGTRDEGDFPEGIAHFVEHTLFRGTRRKRAGVISGYLDRLGGELNAYTTKEEIVLHATVLAADLWKAVGLLVELATEATFPEKEIETERGVVLDEIISYKDNPYEDVFDRFESRLFYGHPLGRLILGTTASVRKITPEMLRSFVAKYFVPERMALTIVSPLSEAVMQRRLTALTDRVFGALPARTEAPVRTLLPPPTSHLPFNRTLDKRHHEVNAVLGGTAPSLYDESDRITAALLSNIVGGPASNSLLNREIREKRGWVYSIECSYTQYADCGIIAISFGCDRPNLDACLREVEKILRGLCDAPLSERRLKAFKKQTLGQIGISSESGEAQCLSMGKSILAWGKVREDSENRAAIEAVTALQLQEMARRILDPDRLSRLIYL